MTRPIRAFLRDSGESSGPLVFTASTEGVKRDGLDLAMSGARLDNYRANPVVLWAHDYMGARLPIGRAEVDVIEGNELEATIDFDQGDPFAVEVERKYRDGYLNAVSVGWNIEEAEGQRVTVWELLDISAVPVPGDAGALIKRQLESLLADFTGDNAPQEERPTGRDTVVRDLAAALDVLATAVADAQVALEDSEPAPVSTGEEDPPSDPPRGSGDDDPDPLPAGDEGDLVASLTGLVAALTPQGDDQDE